MLTNPITVVDARMGRGKSSAAIRYMRENSGDRHFLYVTPFLTEVERICETCDFDQPDSDFMSKSAELKAHLRNCDNVAATHSLFYLMDDEALQLAEDNHYTLIVDESIQVITKVAVSEKDREIIVNTMATESEDGQLTWIDKDYEGKFDGYKEQADSGSLFHLDSAFISILNPKLLRAFDDVFMLTYLFAGQSERAYLDYFKFEYRIVGVEKDESGYRFSDRKDCPPPIDYSKLINIVNNRKMNSVGSRKTALSKNWFATHSHDSEDMKRLRNSVRNFFDNITDGDKSTRLWTCFSDCRSKIVDSRGRYKRDYLQVAARATNEYRGKRNLAYLVNRYQDPNIKKFFYRHDIKLDDDTYALSEMLQWIWRSAIRDDKPINLYIPSSRMRKLLINWIEDMKRGIDE